MRLPRELNERGFRARFLLPVVVAVLLCASPVLATSVVVGDTVYFTRGSAQLSEEAQETLRGQAEWLKEHSRVTVMIEGHTDSWGGRTRNMALGERRAEEVRRFLMEAGLAGTRISVISYGEDRPMALCSKEVCWSQNRRAVTIVASNGETN